MKNTPPRSKLKQQLWKLLLASKCIQRVQAGCDLLLASNVSTESEEHYLIMAGIVVTYSKPFTQNTDVGKLADKYATFSRSELAGLHSELLKARHQLYGHQEHTAVEVAFHVTKPKNPNANQEFELIPMRTEKMISAKQLPNIKELCAEIFVKLRADYPPLIQQLFGNATLTEDSVINLDLTDES